MILTGPILHPGLRRLWWQSVLGWLKRITLLAATPAGIVVAAGLLLFFGAVFKEGLRATQPWLTQADHEGAICMILFAFFLPMAFSHSFTSWAASADSVLFNTPLPRKQILLYTLLRRLTVVVFCSLPVALLLDSHFYADLALRLAGFGAFLLTALTLLSYALNRLGSRARLAAEILAYIPLFFGLASAALLAALRFTGAENARALYRGFLVALRLNAPFVRFENWASTPGWPGALMVSACFVGIAGLFSLILLWFFEPSPEVASSGGLAKRIFREKEARASRLPLFPRLAGAGPLIRIQLLGSFERLPVPFLILLLIGQLPMLVGLGAAKQPGPTSLSMLLFVAAFYAIISETAMKRILFDHMERIKALPVDPFPLLAASLVAPVLGAFAFVVLGLLPSLLLFPAATLALPLGKFAFTLVPLVIFVTAAAQTIMLTIHQQFQRLSMAKRWYQEAAYVASLILAFFISLFLLLLIVAPSIAWRETPWATAAVIASIQLAGTALMFWYARVSYRLIEVLHHND